MTKVRTRQGVIVGLMMLALFSVAFAQGPAKDQGAGETYVIKAEDKLEIHIWKETDLTREVLVRPDGKISLPLVDDVQAAGLKPLELKKVVTERLKEFVSDPQVTVIVKDPRKFKVYLIGNLMKPGIYVSTEEVTYLQAIALAGGLNEWASNKTILISREGEKESRRVINYKDVISGEALDQNAVLKSGDTIIVP